MTRRAVSPALSENEVDIAGALFADDDDSAKLGGATSQDGFSFDADGIFNAGGDGSDDDEAFIALQQAASFRKGSNIKGKSVKKGGGFQAMGLNGNILRAIARKGFTVPTPIQRKTIPLILSRKDVVGMARTGSGKTAAFVIPMIERLKSHSVQVGARAIIMSPSRELAIQTLKVVKELGRGTDLKTVLLVGGDSLEEQFGLMTTNPDIVIATPGRFLHLKVEMGLDLSSVKYVVFDEADRLFEMGFATQLTEILHALPPSRQTLLFSATLPASLVEFANAGLQDPELVRLDAETKISPDLHNAFFTIKAADKEGALLYVLHDVIKMPLGLPEGVKGFDMGPSKKRKRSDQGGSGKPTEHSTIVFAATKHRVEYLANLLEYAGFAVSFVFGSLDQEARRIQVEDFRRGRTNVLVVTDVAARGIDIPVLQNVINYDFPPQPKVFVHRVGRTARAGQQGWSYSLVRDVDAPYLVDLQLFLGRKLVVGPDPNASFTQDIVVGGLPRTEMGDHVEWLNKTLHESTDMTAIRRVADKAERLYMKTRNSAASESAKRARELVASKEWSQLNMKFGIRPDEQAYTKMLASIGSFKPSETIFEIGRGAKSANNEAAEVMRLMRKRAGPRRTKKQNQDADADDDDDEMDLGDADEAGLDALADGLNVDGDFHFKQAKKSRTSFQDPEIFMTYQPRSTNVDAERHYGVHAGSNFVLAARDAAMDLTNDETAKSFGVPSRRGMMRWDKEQKSGVKIAASFQSGRFERWKKARRLGGMPREATGGGGRRFKHTQEKAPKEADKYRDDYKVRKKRVDEAREKRVGRFKDGEGSKREIKGLDGIRKARKEKEKKQQKNARPSKRR
ncbi:unnamed protein product [Parascedosporium putredinis]|uniref:RNA helicase n=1 Tax=Parascedosporium putredinis TaxID=1442378 RepID=A0A9P1H2K4_9PEZI|nr:unnamed protein product [Parascedosporium putredinis]CAI7995024.1 unnamed protein product [Parascedosporium putredinis]